MAKKENNDKNFSANKAWKERKAAANRSGNQRQVQYRVDALSARISERKMTEKNIQEAARLNLI